MIYRYKALVSFYLSARPASHMPSESSQSTMTWHSKREKWVRKSESDRGWGGETEWQRVRGERGKTLDACFTRARLYVGLNTTIFPTISFCVWLHAAKKKQKNKNKKNQVTLCNNAPLQIKCNYRKKTLWHKVNKKNVKRHTANQDIGHFNVWLPCSSEFKGRVWQPADSYISFFWCIQKMDV